jgi:hypothetical protein
MFLKSSHSFGEMNKNYKKKLMGLEFKTFNTLASRMSSFATISGLAPIGSGSKPAAKAPAAKAPAAKAPAAKAPAAKAPAASSATPKECAEFNANKLCHRGQSCHDVRCKNASRAAAVSSPKTSGKGGDGGISANIAAMEARLVSQIDSRFQAAEASMKSGFSHLTDVVAQSQIATQQSFQGLANAMATAFSGGQRQLPPSERRQIGNGGAQEVAEPQPRISYGQNAGWDKSAERFDRSSTHSSQRPQIGAACGGSAQEFHRESVQSPATCSTAGMSKFDAAAQKWNKNPKNFKNNGRIIAVIQRSTTDVDMQCMLLALVNSKTWSEIVEMYGKDVASLLSIGNTLFFQSFFTSLIQCGLPPNFDVKVDSSKTKTGNFFCMTYLQLSQLPCNVDKLVTFLRSE